MWSLVFMFRVSLKTGIEKAEEMCYLRKTWIGKEGEEKERRYEVWISDKDFHTKITPQQHVPLLVMKNRIIINFLSRK